MDHPPETTPRDERVDLVLAFGIGSIDDLRLEEDVVSWIDRGHVDIEVGLLAEADDRPVRAYRRRLRHVATTIIDGAMISFWIRRYVLGREIVRVQKEKDGDDQSRQIQHPHAKMTGDEPPIERSIVVNKSLHHQ